MKHIYLVRHGETTHNKNNLIQDNSTLLSESGLRQANVLAERVRALDFDQLIVSDMERTKQTAEPIAAIKKMEPLYSDLFREVRRPSNFINKSRESEGYIKYCELEYINAHDFKWYHSDEENFSDLLERTKKAVEFLETLTGDILVVSHSRFMKFLLSYAVTEGNLTPEFWVSTKNNFWSTNTGITTFKIDKGIWKLITFNDHAHFAE